ncbi:hypothetical protein F4813DRAFT_393056 [Daldinia decipiens]|uniref:uncharacterized protein n=1 Tax=Daldinia decipiens TaxID=326647 RepID=UPI0020C53D32|nr:uncharacterized protein F4813DRAFT_393056 [Daldinia decipiens]KAI1654112.1 hypothetical protein F4813DRAFT_393056 [Daldinia decipiens]
MSIHPVVFILVSAALLCTGSLFACSAGTWRAQSMDEQRYEVGAMVSRCIAVLSLLIMVLAYAQHGINVPLAFFIFLMAPTIRTHLGKRAAQGIHLQQTPPVLGRQLNQDISSGNTSTESIPTRDGSIRDTFPVQKAQSRNALSDDIRAQNGQTESNVTTLRCKGKNKRVTFADAVTDLERLRQLRKKQTLLLAKEL